MLVQISNGQSINPDSVTYISPLYMKGCCQVNFNIIHNNSTLTFKNWDNSYEIEKLHAEITKLCSRPNKSIDALIIAATQIINDSFPDELNSEEKELNNILKDIGIKTKYHGT